MIPTMKKNFGASEWSQFDHVTKTQIIRTEGFSFADKSPGTDPTYAA